MNWENVLELKPNDPELFTYVFSKIFKTNMSLKMVNFQKKYDFERIELLGDSLLQLIVTELLFHQFECATPGNLSRLRSRMVRNETLHIITKLMGMEKKLTLHFEQVLNAEEMQTSFENVKNQADIFESLVGCVFLDSGWNICKKWVCDIYEKYNILEMVKSDDNYIDLLQGWCRQNLPPFNSVVTPDRKTIVSCFFGGVLYSCEGQYKPQVKQQVCYQILKDLIEKKLAPATIFDFKET